jgi:selenium metabolism protein YedF
MIKIDAMGLACPIPVIQTKKAIRNIEGSGSVETLVDNEASMENLLKMAKEMKLDGSFEKLEDYKYRVTIEKKLEEEQLRMENGELIIKELPLSQGTSPSLVKTENKRGQMVVAIASDKMGMGIDELGDVLMKGFIYTLTEMDVMPTTVLFYNGGAKLTVEGAPTLADLKLLEAEGVEILTCGTCLNYYNSDKKLAVGEVTNMYTIMERLQGADKIIKP